MENEFEIGNNLGSFSVKCSCAVENEEAQEDGLDIPPEEIISILRYFFDAIGDRENHVEISDPERMQEALRLAAKCVWAIDKMSEIERNS